MATQPLSQPAEVEQPTPQTKRSRFWRLGGIVLVGLLGLLVLALAVIYGVSSGRLNRRYDLVVQPPMIPNDAASLARGQHLASAVTGCTDCHGADLSGHTFADAPPFLLVASNLTRGAAGWAVVTAMLTGCGRSATACGRTAKPCSLCPQAILPSSATKI